MQLVCPCLNVTVHVIAEEESFREASIDLDEIKRQFGEDADDPFLDLCERGGVSQFLLLSENGIIEKLPALMRKRSIGKWEIRRCLLCGADAYAIRSNGVGNQTLVNTKLFLHDIAAIDELRKSPEISLVFQVILPKKEKIPTESNTYISESGNGYSNGASTTMVSRTVLKSVQTCFNQYLSQQQQAMEDCIREFVEKEQGEFDRKREDARAQKAALLHFLAHGGGGSSADSLVGATMDEDFDGALPLSPLSCTSGGPSPGLTGAGDAVYFDLANGTTGNNPLPLRPKSLSNPVTLNGYKRKRHSGNAGVAPGLSSHPEEHQDIFSFDEQDAISDIGNFQTEDDGNVTDDSGTGEEFNKYYPPQTVVMSQARNFYKSGFETNGGFCFAYCGKSLPVRTPAVAAYRPTIQKPTKVLEVRQEEPGEMPKDVGASMQALALSMQGADDPERLFGERPQRRRWKTGEDAQRQRHHSAIDEGATVVFLKGQENQ